MMHRPYHDCSNHHYSLDRCHHIDAHVHVVVAVVAVVAVAAVGAADMELVQTHDAVLVDAYSHHVIPCLVYAILVHTPGSYAAAHVLVVVVVAAAAVAIDVVVVVVAVVVAAAVVVDVVAVAVDVAAVAAVDDVA